MSHLYDYAWAQIPAPSMAAVSGCIGVMRYVNDTKALTQPEIANLHKAGLGIGLIYEAGAADLEHPERALAIAQRANVLADTLGAPSNVPIFYCHDANDSAQGAVVASYGALRGASKRPAGLYGSAADLDTAKPLFGWQVESWHPKFELVSPYAHLVQLANTKAPLIPGVASDQYDTNISYRPFPLWGATNAPTASSNEKDSMDIYWRSDTHGPNGAWPYRIVQGSTIIYDASGTPDPTYGIPMDYVGFYQAQSAEVKATIHPILANATVWDALTEADRATRSVSAASAAVDANAVAAAVLAQLQNHPLIPKA